MTPEGPFFTEKEPLALSPGVTNPDFARDDTWGTDDTMGDEILLRADEDIRYLLQHPEEIGQRVGFGDLGEMHGEWIREMVFGEGDYTL